ncbi:hypothetical protein MMC18_001991 [Xylographa bjoerkii]|nr:hypothetical protein [Xylographa bjoerkii]
MPDPIVRLLSSQAFESEDGGQKAFCASEKYIAVTLFDKSVHILNHDGIQQRIFTDLVDSVWKVAIHEDRIFMSQDTGTILHYDILSGAALTTLTGHTTSISALQLSTQALPTLFSGSRDGSIRVWDLLTATCLAVLSGTHTTTVRQLHADAATLFSCSDDGMACIWDLRTYTLVHTLRVSDEATFGVASTAAWFATGSGDGHIRVWARENGSLLASFEAHEHVVNGLLVHEGTLVSTGTDGWAKVWSLGTFELLSSMKMHDHAVTARGIANGWLVTGGKDGGYETDFCGLDARLRAWDVDAKGIEGKDQEKTEFGTPAIAVLGMEVVRSRVVVSMIKRGRPMVEVWEVDRQGNGKVS